MTVFSDPLPDPAQPEVVTASVLLRHKTGLHARPSVKLTKLAKRFSAKIFFAALPDGPWVNAKSIIKVMATKTPCDTMLHFRAEGLDAAEAVSALIDLVERDFPDDG